jgi:hypothetical protein
MIYYKLTKVAEAISHLLEAERAFNELEACGILDYDVTYNRCIVHCIAAFEVLEKQAVNIPDIKTKPYSTFYSEIHDVASGNLFAYFKEARNAYLHSHRTCICIDVRDGEEPDLGRSEFISLGIKAGLSRFSAQLAILPHFELHAGGHIALRPVPTKPRNGRNQNDVPVPQSRKGIDISNFTPKQCLELLLLAVGKLVCDAHEITRVV